MTCTSMTAAVGAASTTTWTLNAQFARFAWGAGQANITTSGTTTRPCSHVDTND
jgi:hypothetical protein